MKKNIFKVGSVRVAIFQFCAEIAISIFGFFMYFNYSIYSAGQTPKEKMFIVAFVLPVIAIFKLMYLLIWRREPK